MGQPMFVTHVRAYSFPDKRTGELIEGCEITCISDQQDTKQGSKGLPVISFPSRDVRLVEHFTALPGIYDLETVLQNGMKNRPEVVLINAHLIAALDLSAVISQVKAKG